MTCRKHVQTQSEWESERAEEIINFIKSEIYLDLPYMQIALGALTPVCREELALAATDGACYYFNAAQMIRLFGKNTVFLDRAYLHSILHCIFAHLWMAADRDRLLWGMACDIAVEYTLDHMDRSCTRRALSWIRQQTYGQLHGQFRGISAAQIYTWILEQDAKSRDLLLQEFVVDDHRFWPKQNTSSAQSPSEAAQNWNRIARQTAVEQKRHGQEEGEGQAAFAAQVRVQKNRRSYRDFLRKFAVLREELQLDLEEFDLGYYSYGLRLYGNMPLLEPLESREVQKIREFVLVLDTSYSTSGALIEHFLKETYAILTERDSFFCRSRIRILQCDDRVQRDDEVHSVQEIEALLRNFTLSGGGGTDFCPAFDYVNELLEDGQLKNLSGLLYFTDGKGVYPKKRPSYRTAFLFLDEYDEAAVPPWAIRMRLLQ